jgi:hypothetical protein
MTTVIIAAIVAFVIVGVVLGRQTAHRKKEAIASLKEEQEKISSVSIIDIANAEIDELGLRTIEGGADLSPDVILRVWKDAPPDLKQLPHTDLRFVTEEGTEPAEAPVDKVHVERSNVD